VRGRLGRPRTAPPRRRRDSALLSDTFETDGIDNAADFLGQSSSEPLSLPFPQTTRL
jgi:hypothetical protein